MSRTHPKRFDDVLRTTLVPAVAVMLALTGCSSDSGTGPGGGSGTGSVQVSGAVSLAFSGPAVSGTDDLTGQPTFGVSISENGTGNTFDVVFLQGRPGPGTYVLGPPSTAAYGELGVTSGFYESIVGTVEIASSSAQAIAGSATFTALRLGGQAQVTVTASFDARCLPVPGLVSCP